jgi:hypothetical protein
MEIQLQTLLKGIVTAQNYGILIKQICEDQIMSSNELLVYVFDHRNEIQNEEKLTNRCQSMSTMHAGKKGLTDIQKKYQELTQADLFRNTKKYHQNNCWWNWYEIVYHMHRNSCCFLGTQVEYARS